LARAEAWDPLVTQVEPDGSFAFEGLPAELYALTSRIPGYTPSPENESYDFLNHEGLLGRLAQDVDDLTLLFDPGVEDSDGPMPDASAFERYEALCKSPLRGVPMEAKAPRGR